jgi:hypothetical protein
MIDLIPVSVHPDYVFDGMDGAGQDRSSTNQFAAR